MEAYEELASQKERSAVQELFREAHFNTVAGVLGKKPTHTCTHCKGTFVGSVIKCVRHFLPHVQQMSFTDSSNYVKVCALIGKADNEIKRAKFFASIVKQYEVKRLARAAAEEAKKAKSLPHTVALFKHKPAQPFVTQQAMLLDRLLLELVVADGLPPSIVESERFQRFVKVLQGSPVEYKLPRKKALGADATNCQDTGLGRVLKRGFLDAQLKKLELLHGVSDIGGTLMHDGAKHRKRNVLNAALMTQKGPLFVQATDASGVYKSSEYLADDVIRACSSIGWSNVFLVAMDGAGVCIRCLAILQQTANPPMDVTRMPFFSGLTDAGKREVMAALRRIFTQRCATHAGDLVANGIGKLFEEAVRMSVKLITFLSQHDFIYTTMMRLPGHHALVMAVETRFAKQIYSTERILKDMAAIKAVLNDAGEVAAWLNKQMPSVRALHKEVTEWIALDTNLQKLRDFVAVEVPVRVFIRRTDGHAPSLGHLWADYHCMRNECLAEAGKIGGAIEIGVRAVFEGRERDCVSDAALAAAAVMPEYALDKRRSPALPASAQVALLKMMKRYFSDPAILADTITPHYSAGNQLYVQFARGTHVFETYKDELDAAHTTGGAVFYWENVAIFAGDEFKPAIGFFIRLVTAHGGQGGAERQNKQVKKFRTTTRNRQTHKVTAAYMEIDMTLRMRDAVTAGQQMMPYLKAVRRAIQDALEDADEEDEGQGGGDGGGDGVDEGGGLDADEVGQRALGWREVLGMFHHGVPGAEEEQFVQGDVEDLDD